MLLRGSSKALPALKELIPVLLPVLEMPPLSSIWIFSREEVDRSGVGTRLLLLLFTREVAEGPVECLSCK